MNTSITLSLVLLLLPYEMEKSERIIMEKIKTLEPISVTLTTYTTSAKETDSTPNITASGFKIDTLNPMKHKIIAVSRDLKKKWRFGTKVRITGAGKYNGTYYVRDLMNKRYKKRIDILIGKNHKQIKLEDIKIYKI
jgi:3D (Asp-Asp-Asp) domain-containing protein